VAGVKILVVDNGEGEANYIRSLLPKSYQIVSATVGPEAIGLFQQIEPDILLLELSTNGLEELEFCRDIEAIDKSDHLHIGVISSNDSLKQRYYCYEAGVVDYFVKPFEVDDFCAKVRALVHIQQQNLLVPHPKTDVIAKTLNESEQYEALVRFIKQTYGCEDVYALAQTCFDFMTAFHLSGCLQIRLATATLNLRPGIRPCSPIEEDLFDMVKPRGEILEFDEGLALNEKHVTILIKNMIFGEPEDQLRLRGFLEVVIQALEAKMQDIARKDALKKGLQEAQQLLGMIGTQYKVDESGARQLLNKVIAQLDVEFDQLNLSEVQEHELETIVVQHLNELYQICTDHSAIDASVRKVLSYLESQRVH